MKKRWIKSVGAAAGLALTFSLFAACGQDPAPLKNYDDGVVKAFYAVSPTGELVSQTAEADGQQYRVTVITSASVAEYSVNASFEVVGTDSIIGDAAPAALVEGSGTSALETAFEEALRLSSIAKEEVEGFDFDRDTYMGKAVYKVEIEDAAAEYSYIFDASDFTLLASETELKSAASSKGSSYIGESRAREIALDAAKAENAEGFTIRCVSENGAKIYKTSFSSGNYLYAVDIDAVSGKIVKFSKSVSDGSVTPPEIPSILSVEEVRAIALGFVFPEGAGSGNAVFRKTKLDYEDGMFLYEVELIAGGTEYEFEIAADTGVILDVEIGGKDVLPQSGQFLTREQAVEKVLAEAGAGAFVVDTDIEKRYAGGEKRYYYEIEVKVDGREREYFVDAVTGEVTLNEAYAGNPANPNPALSEEEAMQIALDTFRLTEDMITSKKIKLEREDGRLCYEIKLMVGKTEYEIDIDAETGTVLGQEVDRDHEDELPSQPQGDTYLTREQAIAAVEAYFSAQGKSARVDRDVDLEDKGTGANKRYYYEVDAYVGNREYECLVDAITGAVSVKGELVGSGKTLIGEERALEIALDRYSLTKQEARVIKVKLEEDDGILIYEVEFKVNDLEYSFEIDAETGKILDIDISFD